MQKYLLIYKVCMSPALKESSKRWCFKRDDVLKVCDGIIFDFYVGLPHVYVMN